MKQSHFDIAIIGAGISGLSLAWELIHSKYRFNSLLLLDRRDPLSVPNRTFSFWSAEHFPFEEKIKKSWDRVRIRAAAWEKDASIDPYKFCVIDSHDYIGYLLPKILKDPRVTFSTEPHNELSAGWIFDSSFPKQYPKATYFMHSTAWEVAAPKDYFDPGAMVFCDFPADAPPGTFYYILPFTAQRAVVYFVQWKLSPEYSLLENQRALEKYLSPLPEYNIERKEHGVIPLFASSKRQTGDNVLAIGQAGGLVRGSTGYGLTRIWRDSRNIVSSLEKHGHPFSVPKDPLITRVGDACFRHLIKKYPENARVVLRRLFENNKASRALEFLDGNAGLSHLPQTMLKVTPWPFLKSYSSE